MIDNPIIFYPSAVFIIMFALISICCKNIIYSLINAILVFFLGGLFFYILNSEYNAIIQIAIYGLAVPIIIGISIMFTSGKKESKKNFTISYLTILCSAIFILAFTYLILMSLIINPDTFNLTEIAQTNTFDTISAFAKGIFINYVWAFELVSLLLLIIIAGITTLRIKSHKGAKNNE